MSIEPFVNSASAITPIVFCASFAPWVYAKNVPESSWPSRKVAVRRARRHPLEDPEDSDQQDEGGGEARAAAR